MNSISLLIPCYNASQYIQKFIFHLEALKLHFTEIIFYDDASTDNTLEILNQSGYKVIKGLINKGPGYSRNRLAEIATSNYIHFHDIDDEFDIEFNSFISATIVANKDVAVADADWINAKTKQLEIKWRYSTIELPKDTLAYLISNPLGVINTIYKKEQFLKIGGFNENLNCWEDSDLHVKLAYHKKSFFVYGKVVAYSLRHNDGISQDQNKCWECRFQFLKTYLNTFSKKYQKVILNEISNCAYIFFRNKNNVLFYEALKIASNYGLLLPQSNHLLLKILKKLKASPYLLFALQTHFRK